MGHLLSRKVCRVEGQNGSKMYFCMPIYWAKTIGELLLLETTSQTKKSRRAASISVEEGGSGGGAH